MYKEEGLCASLKLMPSDEPGGGRVRGFPDPKGAQQDEDLPYVVELWGEDKSGIEQVLAITASGSIGYAAYFAATKEFPRRYITLRRRDHIVSRWNGPAN